MKRAITILILSCLALAIYPVLALEPYKIYFLGINYNNGSLALAELRLMTGYSTLSSDNLLPYKTILLSNDGKELYSGFFDIDDVVYAAPPIDSEGPSPVQLKNLSIGISLPYNKEATAIKILKGGKELLNADVSEYARFCGDSKCQPEESPESCPADCPFESETNKKSKTASQKQSEPEGKSSFSKLTAPASAYFLLSALITALIITAFIFQKKHKRKQMLENWVGIARKKGYSDFQINELLIRKGLKEKEIKSIKIRK